HGVLQWSKNSTGSAQPAWVNSTAVSTPASRTSNAVVVPRHSFGPSVQRHTTRSEGSSSTTSITADGLSPPNQKARLPPTDESPSTFSVHHRVSPSRVAKPS